MKLEASLILTFLMAASVARADATADFAKGMALQSAKERKPDLAAARQAFERAASEGHALAALHLGLLHANGSGGPRDDARAFQYFSQAAADGQREGLYNKGLFLLEGRGVPRELVEALSSLSAAAGAGCIPAHVKLADVYYFGAEDLKSDRARALPHVKAAAVAGDPWACNILGTMSEYGHAMPVDRNASLHWFTVAAKKGNAKAQGNLGRLLRSGDPTPGEMVKSYMWLKLSSLQGNTVATYLLKDHLLGMTADGIAEGDRAVEDFNRSLAGNSNLADKVAPPFPR
jgi:TPR repeat protein